MGPRDLFISTGTELRRLRRPNPGAGAGIKLSAADPLNLEGVLTPEPRISPQTRRRVLVA